MPTLEANEKLTGDLRDVVQDAEKLMNATAGQADAKVNEVRHRLAAALESARATCQRVEEKTVEAAKATDRVIRTHPYESIGVAFGVGLLIGVLVTRNHR